MRIHELEREQWVPRPLPEVFDFFSRAENLGRITPPWLHFQIQTAVPIEMRRGAFIEYRIRLAGLPLRWLTCITQWQPQKCFVDEQRRGPYALWQHTHTFTQEEGGVIVTDHIRYALPLGPFGRAAHALAVRSALSAIFDYRFRSIRNLLGA